MDNEIVLSFENVCYHYKDGSSQVNILKNASYQFERYTLLLGHLVVGRQLHLF